MLRAITSGQCARSLPHGVGNATSTIELTSAADGTLRRVTTAGNFRISDSFPGLWRAVSSIRAHGTGTFNAGAIEIAVEFVFGDRFEDPLVP